MVATDGKKALEDADVIFVDVQVTNYEVLFKAIAPYLKDGQIVNFSTYGYWASLRVANILKQMGKEGVILSESPAPMYWSSGKDGHAASISLRKHMIRYHGSKGKTVYEAYATANHIKV